MMKQILNLTLCTWFVAVFGTQSSVCGQVCQGSKPLTVYRLDEGVYYGAAPKREADFAKLRRLGVRHVIDIRTFKVFATAVERRRAAKYGISVRRIPTGFFPTKTGTVPQILSLLKSADGGGVYFHCNLGSDRAGMLSAIYQVEQLGWDPADAWKFWKTDQFNPKLKDLDRYFWQRVSGSACPPTL